MASPIWITPTLRTRFQDRAVARMQRHAFEDNESGSALGPRLMVGGQFIRHGTVMTERGTVGRVEDSIGYSSGPRRDGLQNM